MAGYRPALLLGCVPGTDEYRQAHGRPAASCGACVERAGGVGAQVLRLASLYDLDDTGSADSLRGGHRRLADSERGGELPLVLLNLPTSSRVSSRTIRSDRITGNNWLVVATIVSPLR